MSTALVHLAWGPAGVEPFRRFIAAYRGVSAGADHELVLLLNGFSPDADLGEFRRLAPEAREVTLETPLLDLQAYREVAAQLEHPRVCFVNSYSRPLRSGWLGTLMAPLARSTVGAAGASGSWGSHLSYNLFQLGLSSRFGDAFPGRAESRRAMREVTGAVPVNPAREWLYALWITARHRRGAARFPSPHMRTNAFAMDRVRFLEFSAGPLRTKWETYRLESGPGSLTARLRAAGRPPVVVDRHGTEFAVESWPRADVYFQNRQQDLLVADNQTDSYANAESPLQRQVLSASAWGPLARPGVC